MEKEIEFINIGGTEINFNRAVLYVGKDRKNKITYILTLQDPKNIPNPPFSSDIDIVTMDGEKRTIEGTLELSTKDKAVFYVAGEPFPVTESELNQFG